MLPGFCFIWNIVGIDYAAMRKSSSCVPATTQLPQLAALQFMHSGYGGSFAVITQYV